ncbi:DUF6221 family protein [Nonomuraea sp. NPDC050153]|uniref:DUF6221 family protein n=1 Tax=Nonomuraea sp. NPDC050153 TaxID=3364359 RepID=UPI0037A9B57F
MDDLITFLKARLDEIDPNDFHDRTECDLGKLQVFGDCSCKVPDQVRRSVEAGRRLVDEYAEALRIQDGFRETGWEEGRREALELACRLRAQDYADREGFEERWKL